MDEFLDLTTPQKVHQFDFGSGVVTHSSWDLCESKRSGQQSWPYDQDRIQGQEERIYAGHFVDAKGTESRGAFLVTLVRDHTENGQ
jgi:hypothetical protein